ncbi:Chromatin modification-related YNG2 [Paramuricea clavata]|uniref:Chromatin modification-related YNG2 n=1 Tax=Paramuricea clavata TaxID=317549 RepID=A0A6S7K2Z2_PARCT|nr:Chromatin modification-related YNG2 [Paramuricea clavata]
MDHRWTTFPYLSQQCSKCQGKCAGHFLSQVDNLAHYKKHGTKGMMINPPSKILSEAHKTFGASKPSEEQLIDLAKKTLLTTEHVNMWFEHLDTVQKNRAEGVKKAKAKRG